MIVVCGAMHSGTSLVAGSLKCLGVYMGEANNNRHEDTCFAKDAFNLDLLKIVGEREQQFDIWGFKWPYARNWFKELYPHLNKPHFIYCYRSLSLKVKRRPERYVITEHLEEGAFWGKFFKEHNDPLLVVDFDSEPERLVKDLVEFLGLQPSPEQIAAALAFNNKELGYSVLTN